MGRKITLSVIKADVGGFVGHSSVYPELLETARGISSKWGRFLPCQVIIVN